MAPGTLRAGVVGLATLGLLMGTASALQPADKVAAVASNVEVMQVQGGAGSSSSIVTLLRGTLRNSSPTDLLIDVTAETGLYTTATLLGSGESEGRAKVVVWLEIDGAYVPVTYDSNGDGVFNDPDNGRVVFNNRDFGLSSTSLAAVLTAFQRTRSANAFQWVALNVRSGIHTIEVKASLETTSLGAANAAAAVGKRVMVVEPAKLANDATI